VWWTRRREREPNLQREIRADLELEAEEQEANGLSPHEARYAAARAFGNVTCVKEEVRAMGGSMVWETIFQELRYACRTLRKSPGFAATAIPTLALGIGASTAVFTVVDSIILKPLGFRDSGRLVTCWEGVRFLGADAVGPNPRHVEMWRQRASAFSGLTYLRTFVPEDRVKGHDNVAVLTYSLWQELFHGDPSVIGASIRLVDVSCQVVGVLPAGFHFPSGRIAHVPARPNG
jgi:hypothetical protein